MRRNGSRNAYDSNRGIRRFQTEQALYRDELDELRSARHAMTEWDRDPEPYWHKETGMCGDRDDARGDY